MVRLPRHLLFAGRYPAVIDTVTMKMSYLPDEFLTNNHFEFSPDFSWAAVVEKDGLHIGRVLHSEAVTTQPL